MKRRTYLSTAVGSLTALSLAGVAGASVTQEGPDGGNETQDDDANGSERGDGDRPAEREYVRGAADVDLAAHEVEDGEHVEYLESEDRVKFATVMSGDEPVQFETDPWEEWAEMQVVEPAAERAATYIKEEHGIDVGRSITGVVEGRDLASMVSFPHEEYTLDEVAPLTPSSVAVTYEFADKTYEADVPVFAEIQSEMVTLVGDVEENDDEGSSDGDGSDGSRDGESRGDGSDGESQAGDPDESQAGDPEESEEDAQGSGDGDGSEMGSGEMEGGAPGNATDGEAESEPTAQQDDDGFGPGFGIGGAVAALGGAGYLLGRRSGDGGSDSG